jgi:predicted MPP superfamily phosphohydrolase
LHGLINIAGIDDPAGRYRSAPPSVEAELLKNLPEQQLNHSFSKHQPIDERNALGLFDLRFSAHTHRRVFFPSSLITPIFIFPPYGFFQAFGFFCLSCDRGTGTWRLRPAFSRPLK